MSLKEIFFPQDKAYFELIEKQSILMVESSSILQEIFSTPKSYSSLNLKLLSLENEADKVVITIHDKLNHSFITPFDSEDISALSNTLDDTIDLITIVSKRLGLFGADLTEGAFKEFSSIIVSMCREVDRMVRHIRTMESGEIKKSREVIHRFEHEADELLQKHLEELFKSKDPIKIIKLKELFELFEAVTDSCEDVSDVIGKIVLKNR